jgi:hypothetical protein
MPAQPTQLGGKSSAQYNRPTKFCKSWSTQRAIFFVFLEPNYYAITMPAMAKDLHSITAYAAPSNQNPLLQGPRWGCSWSVTRNCQGATQPRCDYLSNVNHNRSDKYVNNKGRSLVREMIHMSCILHKLDLTWRTFMVTWTCTAEIPRKHRVSFIVSLSVAFVTGCPGECRLSMR